MALRLATLLALCTLAGAGGCAFLDGVSAPRGPEQVQLNQPTEAQREALARAGAAKDAGQYDLALAMFQEILAENPTIVTGYLGIGEIHMIRKDHTKAVTAYHHATRLDPRNFDAQYGHGLALHMLERYSDAVSAFHKALTINPEDVDANLALATTYLNLNEARRALPWAERAVELEPGNGAARTNLGAIYELLGRNREAIDQYRAANELMPPSPQLYMNLINVLSREKRYVEVINTAETLLKLEPSANAYERMGHAYFRLRDYDRSLEAYRAAVTIAPRHWQSLNGIGVNSINKWLVSKKRDRSAATEARNAFRQSLLINRDQPKVKQLMTNYQLN